MRITPWMADSELLTFAQRETARHIDTRESETSTPLARGDGSYRSPGRGQSALQIRRCGKAVVEHGGGQRCKERTPRVAPSPVHDFACVRGSGISA